MSENNLAYDLIVKHVVDDRPHPMVWFVKLFASKPLAANQNERGFFMRSFEGNMYPDTTSHRCHLKGQEAAELYLFKKQLERPHVWGRRALVLSIAAFVVFQIVRVL